MSWRRIVATAAVLATAGLTSASAAQAAFHLMQIREVFPGTAAAPNSEYVVLQMWAPGQNFVSGHSVRIFNAAGTEVGATTFSQNVPNGGDQARILLATPQAAAQFGVTPDVELPGAAIGTLDPAGGKVCFDTIDCVSWGNFSGSSSQPSPSGTPAPAIPDGSALQRSIAAGCPTLLESVDDTNNSSVDFTAVAPVPRNNNAAPTDLACASGPGQPQTVLRKKPPKRARDRTPSFRFSANQAGASFQCKVDRKPFRSCRSPYTTKPLLPGKHTFKVRARTAGGFDASPASYTFTVLGKRPPGGVNERAT